MNIEHTVCLLEDLFPEAHTMENEEPIRINSFKRSAQCFYTGIMRGLESAGLSESQIIEVLKSKDMRWMLDQRGEELTKLGRDMVSESMIEYGKTL